MKAIFLPLSRFRDLPVEARLGIDPDPESYEAAVQSPSLRALHEGIALDGALLGVDEPVISVTRLLANVERAVAILRKEK
ncbi:hypothetical protein [Segniliparus rugosus]|uniref:Uncharacterized protein n=1 Tax=Segniliparus rugosus (strain ATCC BAA-974 / DSM 45345 / CCUG 50838 / CIP 108380 / JCM 13579 / CDC 945) TaxID=679197 RepID=E5XT33_SEGRC|nr:hypothetical protein [Segniliparus rugosus]EFV12490.1 hypothetical protein HMPREF9336_02655 [Segniliparus rugosus ATCC BAA-974]